MDHKHSKIKQYYKEGRALRTETTINDTGDFGIGRRLCNLPALAQVGYTANRPLLDVERLTADPAIGQTAFTAVATPVALGSQRASALPLHSARTQALLAALVVFPTPSARVPQRRPPRPPGTPLLGLDPSLMTQGRMTYELRRLRLHGLIARIPGSHRYQVTDHGLRIAVYLTRVHNRLVRPGLSQILDDAAVPRPLRRQLNRLTSTIGDIARNTA